ncbi:MAG TPA: hypothetical protein VJ485_02915 [archaeon]|nr:hypothetical protein [archaeon]
MDWKGFLRPDKIKIITLIVLFASPLALQIFLMGDIWELGFPLPFIIGGVPQCGIGSICEPYLEFSWTSLIVDIFILFFVTLLILLIYGKLEKISKNTINKSLFLTLALFSIFIVLSLVLSVGYPLPKGRIGIGLPLYFYAYDPYSGLGIHLGPLFMPGFLLIDLIYCYIVSVIIIRIQDGYKK